MESTEVTTPLMKLAQMKTTTKTGRIVKDRKSNEWTVYDADGNYLGWTEDRDEAQHMARTGFTNNLHTDEAAGIELDLWDLWNSAAERGRVWDCGNDVQAIALTHEFMLTAHKDDSGWEVEIHGHDEFWEQFADEREGICAVTVAKEPFHLS